MKWSFTAGLEINSFGSISPFGSKNKTAKKEKTHQTMHNLQRKFETLQLFKEESGTASCAFGR